MENGGDEYQGDDEDADGNLISEVSPGQFERLPAGIQFEAFDPQHPTSAFKDFGKQNLRGVSAGLGPSYNCLASDAESVSFSSLRYLTLEDRDLWMHWQHWLLENLHARVHPRWLRMAFLMGNFPHLPFSKFSKFNAPAFQPRRWPWVQPEKEAKGKKETLGMTSSYQRLCGEQGVEFLRNG